MNSENQCPRCEGRLRSWADLNDEERELVKRLPDTTGRSLAERQTRHRWCTRCWFEDTGDMPTLV